MTTEAVCIHHFIVDSNNHGACKKCGEARQFQGPSEDYKDYFRETKGYLYGTRQHSEAQLDGWSKDYE